MPKIECIIFDWGGVLIDNPVEDFTIECAKMIGVEVEQLKSTYAEFSFQFERGLISEKELWKRSETKLNIKIKNNHSIWYDCFKKIYSPREHIFNLAKQLKHNGYKVALLSNTESPAMKFFNDQNYDMFDYKIFSCKEGEAKPEPQLYEILLDKINIPAQNTLFIDDKSENIATAKKLNMNAIQYIDTNLLLKNLGEYDINFNIHE